MNITKGVFVEDGHYCWTVEVSRGYFQITRSPGSVSITMWLDKELWGEKDKASGNKNLKKSKQGIKTKNKKMHIL